MNREIRELFDQKNIITKKITIKKNVRIIDTGEYNYAPVLSIIGDDEEINFYNSI